VAVRRWDGRAWSDAPDEVAAEEPLQVRLDGAPLTVVMRTPGADVELALGLLHAERVIREIGDVARIAVSAEAPEAVPGVAIAAELVESNTVDVRLAVAPRRVPERTFLATSACGVCGATTVDDIAAALAPLAPGPALDPRVLGRLGEALRDGQEVFARTGGLHAAAVFTVTGDSLLLREDVGRHNAVDKVVGRLLAERRLPAADGVLVVSARAGYEVVQKAVAAGFPALVAVGAPSSLGVQVARRFGLTLAGFARGGRFNLYSGAERLSSS
jgi:FdhD protein